MSDALLVIDMQEAYVGEHRFPYLKYSMPDLLTTVNGVIDAYADEKRLIVYIRNVMERSLLSRLSPFKVYEDTLESKLVEGLHVASNHVFVKHAGDAFSNPQLHAFLKENNVDSVKIVGVDGGGCVALTALGAIENGYHVVVNERAIGTTFERSKAKYFKKLRKLGAEFI